MLNSIVLMGRLVADPELRTTTTGKTVCSFRIAVDRSYARAGEQRQTDFIPVVAWESTGNFVGRYFAKGSMIAVQGQLQSRQYEDSTGAKRTAYEVVAREVSFCGSRSETGTIGQNIAVPVANAPQMPAYQTAAPGDFEEITDDEDLPF